MGQIITFYSYKGGVGRSFTLANVAALLAKWGHRVLCVDWDLEAPGLNTYFAPWFEPASLGLIDAIEAVAKGRKPRWNDYCSTVKLPRCKGALALITAEGRAGTRYAQRVQAIDWNRLYEESDLGTVLEAAREQWKRQFDFVLVDSRTGISDVAGITTIHLPDLLVVVLTPNEQSLNGVFKVATSAVAGRSQLPVARARLQVLPVVARFDLKVEFKVAAEWLKRIEERLRPLYEPWLPRNQTIKEMLNYTRIPQVAFWSFGESLPVVVDAERDNDPEAVNYALHNVAALLANALSDAHELLIGREAYIARAAQAQVPAPQTRSVPPMQVFLSHAVRSRKLAGEVAAELARLGLPTETSGTLESFATEWKTELFRVVGAASVMAVLLDGPVESYQLLELETFVSTSLRQKSFNRIIPVVCNSEALKNIPPLLTDYVFLDARDSTAKALARMIATHVQRQRDESRKPKALKLTK